MALFTRLFFCIFVLGLSLYRYIDKQNQLTQLSMQLPALKKTLLRLEEDNTALHYEIEQFESPRNLLQLAEQERYQHLRYPHESEVVIISGVEHE